MRIPKREDENSASWKQSDLRYCPGCKKFVSASDFFKYHYGKCFFVPERERGQRKPKDEFAEHRERMQRAKVSRTTPPSGTYRGTFAARDYRKRRRFPLGRVIAILVIFSLVGAVVCAFAGVAPFSTAKDWIAGHFSSSDIPPSEDHPYWEHFGKQPPYSTSQFGGRIHLVNNEDATDPTWQQLEAFLRADGTDDKDYNFLSFPCGAFAEEVHNNAEEAGIKAAWVSVDFEGEGSDHALNAFNTTDRGLVYADCTGGMLTPLPVCYISLTGETICPETVVRNYDKVAYIELGKEYGLISLNVVEDFSYESYERYMEDWDAYETAVEAYNAEVDAYNSLYDRCGGYATYGECYRLLSWYDELDSQEAELDRQYTELGGYYWQPLDVVEKVEIWW